MKNKYYHSAKVLVTIFLLLFVVAPLIKLFMSIHPSDVVAIVKAPQFGRMIFNSLATTLISTVISVALAWALAWCINRSNIRFKTIFSVLFTLPMLIPSISHGMGLVLLFGDNGLITNWLGINIGLYGYKGIVMGSLLYSFPVAFLMLTDVFQYEDYTVYEAASVLGLSKSQQFFTITLPNMKKPLISVIFAVFTMIFTDYGVPLVVGGKTMTIPVYMYREVIGLLDFSKGAIIGIILLIPAVIAFIIDLKSDENSNASTVTKPYLIPKSKGRDIFCYIFCGVVLFLICLPLFAFAYLSVVRHYPTGDSREKLMRLSESGAFPGDFNGNLIFSGPVSVLPNYDGTLWVSAYNSNELLLLNQNGTVIKRNGGPINGFDRPSDVIRLHDGNMLVSENAGDRLSLLDENGNFIKYIGEKGRGEGQMVGPLYLAQDYLERLYVTDYGNRRVDVFDKEGNPLFFFGGKQAGFKGLKGPTGIAVSDESVYVADDQVGIIYEFDRAGNYIRELVEPKTFKRPDSIKEWNDSLIVCDSNRIVSVDKQTGAIFEYARTGNGPSRVTTAAPDVNGNVVVSDFTANEVYVMSKLQELVGGLFVQIEQVDASKFPNVTVELRVENRHRQPVVGLQKENFFLTENKQPVTNMKFKGAASNNTEADVTIMIDRSMASAMYQDEIEDAVKEIVDSMDKKGVLRIVSAGAVPVTEYVGKPDLLGDFSLDALKNPVAEKISVDLALRLCANDLINASKKRAVVMISAGYPDSLSFDKYNLTELTSYMSNNSIAFSVVNVNQNALSEDLAYVVDNTPGDTYYVFRPQGLGDVVKDIIEYPQGIYQLSFTSSLSTNFGTSYLPLEAEVYLLNRSGRDETGYFAPLQ